MIAKEIPQDDLDRLKASISDSIGVLASIRRIEVIPDPDNDQIICRLEAGSAEVRRTLVARFHGVAIGGTVYFQVPWHPPGD